MRRSVSKPETELKLKMSDLLYQQTNQDSADSKPSKTKGFSATDKKPLDKSVLATQPTVRFSLNNVED